MTALDIGANNIVACTTTTGQQYLYEGRDLFERFRETTREIARLQSKLREGRYTSKRIRRLYRRRTRRRDHAMDALARDLMERLYDGGISTVYVGDLTDVLETHWSVRANQKTHNFWAFRAFIDRLACTAEEFGITVEVRPEAWTSQTCPQCGSTDRTTRHQDTLTCPCGFEGHADLSASETFLRRHRKSEISGMPKTRRVFEHDSSGTTTTGRSYHTLTKVPKKRAQTRVPYTRRRKSLAWWFGMSRESQREESPSLQGGEDVKSWSI